MRESYRNMSQKVYAMSFPGVKTQVGTQSFRRSHISPILHMFIFGRMYSKLYNHEIIRSGKRCGIIHIASLERMIKLFNINNLCGVEHKCESGIMHTCAGKVSVVNHNGKHEIGFITKERGSRWTILLMDKKEIVLPRVEHNSDAGYVYRNNRSGWRITFLAHLYEVYIALST